MNNLYDLHSWSKQCHEEALQVAQARHPANRAQADDGIHFTQKSSSFRTGLALSIIGMAAVFLALMIAMERPADAQEVETLVADKTVEVPESAEDVDTGIDIKYQDRLIVTADGQIWSGVWLSGLNGPEGWYALQCDPDFPLNQSPLSTSWNGERGCSRSYSLIGKLDQNYFYIGSGYDSHHNGETSRLYLRTNDDVPGNGSDAFYAHIKVLRVDIPPTISDVKPVQATRTKDRTPTITALVRDDNTNLTGSDISLFIDGRQTTPFSYNSTTDTLTYTPTQKLTYGRHTVQIVAKDAANHSANMVWDFRIVRRK